MPVTMASAEWRRRCTASRAASPVIAVDLPGRAEICPSSVSADFSVTNGNLARIHFAKSSFSSRAVQFVHADLDLDTGGAQLIEAASGDGGIGVGGGCDYTRDARGDDRFRAGAGAAGGAARLERDVHGGAAGFFAGLCESDDFGMVECVVDVEALANFLVAADDQGADARVRMRERGAACGQVEGAAHQRRVRAGGRRFASRRGN